MAAACRRGAAHADRHLPLYGSSPNACTLPCHTPHLVLHQEAAGLQAGRAQRGSGKQVAVLSPVPISPPGGPTAHPAAPNRHNVAPTCLPDWVGRRGALGGVVQVAVVIGGGACRELVQASKLTCLGCRKWEAGVESGKIGGGGLAESGVLAAARCQSRHTGGARHVDVRLGAVDGRTVRRSGQPVCGAPKRRDAGAHQASGRRPDRILPAPAAQCRSRGSCGGGEAHFWWRMDAAGSPAGQQVVPALGAWRFSCASQAGEGNSATALQLPITCLGLT